jgi:Protein of unknown function (DUF2490)
MRSAARIAAALLALVGWLPVHAHAQRPAVNDLQAWLLLLGQLPVGDAWIVHAEVQPRWNDDISQRDQLLLRTALGRRLGPRVSVWAGYGYIPRWSDGERFDEQRTWQQLSATFPRIGTWAPSIRIRPEQRYLDEWGDTSHRLRALGRLVRPLGASPWSLALWDEYFVTVDETPGGPAQGFDQNRLFATVLRKLSADVTLEAGYMWQVQPSTASRGTRHGHTLFAWLTYAP